MNISNKLILVDATSCENEPVNVTNYLVYCIITCHEYRLDSDGLMGRCHGEMGAEDCVLYR